MKTFKYTTLNNNEIEINFEFAYIGKDYNGLFINLCIQNNKDGGIWNKIYLNEIDFTGLNLAHILG